MARSRIIKPGFFTNDVLGELPPLCRLLFAGLWCLADRAGVLIYRPKKIKVEILPYDDCDIQSFVDQLVTCGFVRFYEIDGEKYLQITNWEKHQHVHPKEVPSVLPPFSPSFSISISSSLSSSTSTRVHEPCMNHAKVMHEPCIEIIDNSKTKQVLLPLFNKFWLAYPVHKSKEKAFQAFKKINPSEELLQTMLVAIEMQTQERDLKQKNNQFTPEWKLPATWLNGQCWEDEVNLAIPMQNNEVKYNANSRTDRNDAFARMQNQRIEQQARELFGEEIEIKS